MPRAHFAHVETWVFDLDNTLYSPGARLFEQIERRLPGYVMRALGVPEAEASRLRDRYWQSYGTTLAGLMAAAFVQMHLTWSALYAPLMAIVNGLSATG